MDNFVWIGRGEHIYINKTAITTIKQCKLKKDWDKYWSVKMNDGDFFIITEDELNLIIGVASDE